MPSRRELKPNASKRASRGRPRTGQRERKAKKRRACDWQAACEPKERKQIRGAGNSWLDGENTTGSLAVFPLEADQGKKWRTLETGVRIEPGEKLEQPGRGNKGKEEAPYCCIARQKQGLDSFAYPVTSTTLSYLSPVGLFCSSLSKRRWKTTMAVAATVAVVVGMVVHGQELVLSAFSDTYQSTY